MGRIVRRMLRSPLLVPLALVVQVAYAQPYEDVSAKAGLDVVLRASGIAVADIDLDGDLDVYTVSPEERDESDSTTWNHLLRNNGDGTFEEITEGSGIEPFDGGYRRGQQGNRFGASWGDFDGDRYPDLYLTRIGPERLYRNLGDGTFEDVTVSAGVFGTDDTSHDVAASWADLDNDGDLDLYVSAWIGPNRLYINQGDGRFTEEAAERGVVDDGFTWGALPFDVDGDGLTDLYVVNDFGPNRLYLQQESGVFDEATEAWGLGDEGNGMGVALADVNGDEEADVFVTNIADRTPNPLFIRESPRFINRAATYGVHDAGWAWGAEFFDADNDGDQDLYVVNGFPTDPSSNRFFEAQQTLQNETTYLDQSEVTGTALRQEARALTVFDLEADGDQDLLIGNFREPSVLLERITPPGNWIGFWLDGPEGNRWGVGSTIRLEGTDGVQLRYADGIDMLGQSIQPSHFGLGAAGAPSDVSVTWPDGRVDTWRGLAPGRYHTLVYGAVTDREREVPPESALAPYPNPTSGRVWLDIKGPVRVFDVLGRSLGRLTPVDGALQLAGLPSGPLFLVSPEGDTFSVVLNAR